MGLWNGGEKPEGGNILFLCSYWIFFLKTEYSIEENPDYLDRKKILSASQFECVCMINGKLFKVLITSRRAVYDIDKFRYYALKVIEAK